MSREIQRKDDLARENLDCSAFPGRSLEMIRLLCRFRLCAYALNADDVALPWAIIRGADKAWRLEKSHAHWEQ